MKYWELRANKYNKIHWVFNKKLLDIFLKFSHIKRNDSVLDLGCGTGIISKAIYNKVKQLIAMDYSWDMLSQIQEENIIVIRMNIEREPIFKNNFNKILARMVFHHVHELSKTFEHCYNMLKPNGWLIIQEGIPPTNNKEVIDWTVNIRNLKEKRQHFTEQSLIDLYKKSNFKNITYKKIVNKNFSIKNWLKNSWKDTSLYQKIYNAHLNAPDIVKKAYNMRILKDDIIIEAVSFIIKGQK